jgi:hypothetical protein
MDEKTFTLDRLDRDLLFEVLAQERHQMAGLLGSSRRREAMGGSDPSWERAVQALLTERWERVSRLMAAFAEEDEQ